MHVTYTHLRIFIHLLVAFYFYQNFLKLTTENHKFYKPQESLYRHYVYLGI
jgi:hypothetical protein